MNLIIAIALILCMLAAYEFGRRQGLKYQAEDEGRPPKGIGASEGAVFTILGLLMAFTFYGAESRFDARRHQITAEANAIETAYLRLDLLPADAQPALRTELRRYLELRAALYSDADGSEYRARMVETAALQSSIWTAARAAALRPDAKPSAATVLLPALNEMNDITTVRHASRLDHPPKSIHLMLGMISLVASMLAGFDSAQSRRRSWLHILAFCTVIGLTTYVIIDLEYPRHGLIQLNDPDNALTELQAEM